jgi:hypothetical protein
MYASPGDLWKRGVEESKISVAHNPSLPGWENRSTTNQHHVGREGDEKPRLDINHQ